MAEIKPASSETVNKITEGWEKQKEILFSRDGKAPNGNKGQDFANNPNLRVSADQIAGLYIPLIARMLELDDTVKKIETGENKSLRSGEADTLDKWKKTFDEMELLRIKSEKLITDAKNILMKDGSGFSEECSQRGKTNIIDRQNVANEIVGSCIQFLLKGMGCEQKGFIPRSPSLVSSR